MSTSSATRQHFHVESISEESSSEEEESTMVDPRMELKKLAYARAVVDMLSPNQQFDEESLMRRLSGRHPGVLQELIIGTAMAAQVLSQMHPMTPSDAKQLKA